MNKSTQANAKKEEKKARLKARLIALNLYLSYAAQNPRAIRIIRKNGTIFESPSNFANFILDEDHPENLRVVKRTASFIKKHSNDLEFLSDQPSDVLKNIGIPPEMSGLFSNRNIQTVGEFAQKILEKPEVIEPLARVSDFIIENNNSDHSFSKYIESQRQQGVPPSVAIIRFFKDNPKEAEKFMEFIGQNSSDITQIADFLQDSDNAKLALALGFPEEGLEVAKFLTDNKEQIQPAVSMIQNKILKNPELSKKLLDAAEDVALFMDKEENRDALKNILNDLSELNSPESIAEFIENCPQDLHKFCKHTDSIITLAHIFQNPENAQYARMFNLSDKDISIVSDVSKKIVDNEVKLKAIAESADNLLDDKNFEVRSSLTKITTFMSTPESKELIDKFSEHMKEKKEKGISEPVAIIEYMKKDKKGVSEFLNFVADNDADVSNIVGFTQTSKNIKLAETLGLDSNVAEMFSVLDKNPDKIKPMASLINKILESEKSDKLLDSLSSLAEYCTPQENIEFFNEIQSGKYDLTTPEGVESFIDNNYDGAQKFIRFIGEHGEKITDLSQFAESYNEDIKAIGLDTEAIKGITSYINKDPDKFKNAATLASKIFDFDRQDKSTRQAITKFIKEENGKESIQKISQTISELQDNGIQPFSLEGIQELIDKNPEDLKNVLTFIEKNPGKIETFGAFLKGNIEYAPIFGLNKDDAKSIESFLEIIQKNPKKIEPAAEFTKNLIDFYEQHSSSCKKIVNFYTQHDKQIPGLIGKIKSINLNDPASIYSVLSNKNSKDFKTTLRGIAELISNHSEDIVDFAEFFLSKENSELVEKLTEGNEGAQNTVERVKGILNTIKDQKEILEPVATVLCPVLEFNEKHPRKLMRLLSLYKNLKKNGLDKFIKDYKKSNPRLNSDYVDLVWRNYDCANTLIEWIRKHPDDIKVTGGFILEHYKEMAKVLGVEADTLKTITKDYMVNPSSGVQFVINNFDFSLVGAKVAGKWVNVIGDADIKKTDDPNKPLLATADMMKKDQKRAEEKSQNIAPNESLLATADMMKKDKKRAEEKSQNIAQSLKESPKERQAQTKIPLSHNKENFYS